MRTRLPALCCPPKAPVDKRPRLDLDAARRLERTCKVLANGTRLRFLHAHVREPGLCVAEPLDRGLCLMEEAEWRRRRAR